MRSPFVYVLTIFVSMLLLTACDDTSEDDSNCRYYVQQDLDNQEYDSALDRLESTTCQETYSDSEYLVDQASAYLGKAGYTFTDILSAAIAEDEDSDDALSVFTSSIAELENDDSSEYLDLASESYKAYLNDGDFDSDDDCNDITSKTTTEEGICLIQGVISLTETALALDFLSGGEDLETSETLDFSACALYYSIAGATDSVCADFTVTSSSVTFTVPDTGTLKDYENITITSNTDSSYEYFLQYTDSDTSDNSIVFTDGVCKTNFSTSTSVSEASDDIDNEVNNLGTLTSTLYYVCPSEDDDYDSVNDAIVDALNDAIDNIESLAGTFDASDDDLSDIQEAIDEFKADIFGCDIDGDGSNECTESQLDADLTLSDIIDYLENL